MFIGFCLVIAWLGFSAGLTETLKNQNSSILVTSSNLTNFLFHLNGVEGANNVDTGSLD